FSLLLLLVARATADCQFGHIKPDEKYEPNQCKESDNACVITCVHEISKGDREGSEHNYTAAREDPKLNCTFDKCQRQNGEDKCTLRKCQQKNAGNCQYEMECNCRGHACTAQLSLQYSAAQIGRSILQKEDLALYRYSIYDEMDNIKSPVKYAFRENVTRSVNFNPRILVKRELFKHLLNMTLALSCIYIIIHFLYSPLNKLIDKGMGKKKKGAPKPLRHLSRENGGSVEDKKIEEYLKDENMLFNWYHPQQLFTPLACFPKGFPIDDMVRAAIEEKPVRCNQSKEYLTMAA
ncbi:hypothetical protein PENTCL1PPCAC_12756, partial [Pristionchus entomophagus]